MYFVFSTRPKSPGGNGKVVTERSEKHSLNILIASIYLNYKGLSFYVQSTVYDHNYYILFIFEIKLMNTNRPSF